MSNSQNSPPYHSQIAQVPDDILLEVFHHLLEQHGTTIQESNTWLPVTLSHVCSNWRCLTLASSWLWSNIFLTSFSDPAILHQYLARSRDALLRVEITTPMQRKLDLAQILSNHSHRFVSFHLYDIGAKTAVQVLSFFRSPAPQLRSLHILPYTDMSLDPVFDGKMPLLSDMQVATLRVTSRIDLLARKNLTRLGIRFNYIEAEALVNMLRDCPNLEALQLRFGRLGPEDVLRLPGRMPTIPLKHLKELHVECPAAMYMTILPWLSFPRTTAVELVYFPHSLPTTVIRDCASLREITSDVKTATLFFSPRTRGPLMGITVRTSFLKIEVLTHNQAERNNQQLEFTGFSAIPFPALRHLTVRDPGYGCVFPERRWRRIFQLVPTITHLEICTTDAVTILRAIEIDTPDVDKVLCPELTHLVALSGGVDEGHAHAICEAMISCCLARAAAGAPIISCEIVLEAREEIPPQVLARLNEIGVQITNSPNTAEV
ncbi:hypothetical protein B0H21DRAFT_222152 [Amylocystis lapponica]|nr:hypothetical protein B0H21DRAFT_222152 [Amylocystis lapponica]